jgi:hypothetical protein
MIAGFFQIGNYWKNVYDIQQQKAKVNWLGQNIDIIIA